MSEFNLVIVGDGGVGKTTFIKRHITGEFERQYISTYGVENSKLEFYTNHGKVVFNINDVAGQEKFRKSDREYSAADCAIIMFDLSSKISFRNVDKWYADLTNKCNGIPIVLCGNKSDIVPHKIDSNTVANYIYEANYTRYYPVSAKTNCNYEKPFLDLLVHLTGNVDVKFIASPPQDPLSRK